MGVAQLVNQAFFDIEMGIDDNKTITNLKEAISDSTTEMDLPTYLRLAVLCGFYADTGFKNTSFMQYVSSVLHQSRTVEALQSRNPDSEGISFSPYYSDELQHIEVSASELNFLRWKHVGDRFLLATSLFDAYHRNRAQARGLITRKDRVSFGKNAYRNAATCATRFDKNDFFLGLSDEFEMISFLLEHTAETYLFPPVSPYEAQQAMNGLFDDFKDN
ncbi:MAG: hypothetical protein ACMXYE_01465 [Candidatus Woesearchaeota archaeon]